VWKEKGQPLLDREVSKIVKFGGGNIMVWGYMSWEGVGRMAEIEGRMDSKQYVDILEHNLLPTIQESTLCEDNLIFQQDNDPKHTSKLASNWFKNHNIILLDWPAQSPDLNPIEQLWLHLKKQLRNNYQTIPKEVWELWERAAVEWEKIEPEVCERLIESMPQRLEAVIIAKGGNTKY
jgi:transposase